MKIESISIQHFKLFEDFQLSFKNKTLQEVSERFLIIGDNGTGKTSLLQAVALPLALVTRTRFIRSIYDFDWAGFLPARLMAAKNPRIELDVSFEKEEIEATQDVAERWYASLPDEVKKNLPFVKPADKKCLRVVLNGSHWFVGDNNTQADRGMFLGRYYAQHLLIKDSSVRPLFSKLPGIFWFDQFRNLASNPASEENGDGKEKSSGISYETGVGRLRQFLIDWRKKQESGITYRHDFLKQLETLYQSVFPGRSFWGIERLQQLESPTEEDLYFLLSDGKYTYDLVEMSAGEQSVFPILYKIVRQQAAYSVVLIDEVDLNLHPPAAQLLVKQLYKIAPHCQYILTTHSESVNDIIGEDETYRLPGGNLCL